MATVYTLFTYLFLFSLYKNLIMYLFKNFKVLTVLLKYFKVYMPQNVLKPQWLHDHCNSQVVHVPSLNNVPVYFDIDEQFYLFFTCVKIKLQIYIQFFSINLRTVGFPSGEVVKMLDIHVYVKEINCFNNECISIGTI